ncbi:MAG: ELWxxDGT repeat protein [Planctomycetota bacterium]
MFLASPVQSGLEERLFAYDGQATNQLTDPFVEFISFWPLFTNGEVAMSIVSLPGTFRMLLASDGTPEGTGSIFPIADVGPSAANLHVFDVTSGNRRYFNAANPTHGDELWVTDGTTAGTQRITDIAPGPANSSIADLGRLGNELLFYANKPEIGSELWRTPIADGDHVAEPFGQGCAGSSGVVPTIGVTGGVTLGSSVTVEVADAPPVSLAAHFSSLPFDLVDVSGCSIYLGSPVLMLLTPTDGEGRASVPLVVPEEASLVGLNLWWQTLIADPGGALNGAAALTPALEVWIGG